MHVEEFGLEYFEIRPVEIKSDLGYDYDRVMRGESANAKEDK